MKLFRKHFILIFMALYAMPKFVLAENVSESFHWPSNGECDLPAPANLFVKGISTTWVSLEWSVVQEAESYQIEVFSSITASIVSTWNVEETLYTVPDLERGNSYFFRVSAICEDGGTPSENKSNTPMVFTIIIDIKLDVAYPELPAMIACQISNIPEGRCYFSCDGSEFWGNIYKNQSYSMSFLLAPYDSSSFDADKKLRISKAGNDISSFIFHTSWGGDFGETNFVDVYDGVTPVFKIIALKNPCAIEINFYDNFYNSYGMRHIEFYAGDGNKAVHDPNTTIETSDSPKIHNSNPGSSSDLIFTPPSTILQLFNLNGILQLQQTLQPNQNYQDLLTSELPPGFYFLRLETAGVVETRKLIKTQ